MTGDRTEEWLSEQGFGADEQAEPDPDDGQAVLQAAAVTGRAAMGSRRGRRARRLQVLGGRPYRLPPQCASCDGYGLHAGVVIGARDRKGLGRSSRDIRSTASRWPFVSASFNELIFGRNQAT